MIQCTARALIFSGRPDPTWVIEGKVSERLYSLWNGLKPSVSPPSAEPRLGYRGVSMSCESIGEFTAFQGYIGMKIGNSFEWKKDEGRVFERILLSSAPDGSIPAGIIII